LLGVALGDIGRRESPTELSDGEIVDLASRRRKGAQAWSARIRASASALCDLPAEVDDQLRETLREQRAGDYCKAPTS